jgi:hypothetical protein
VNRPTTVESSANLIIVLESCVATQSWVNREYRRELSTDPCGAPVLRVSVVKVMLPTLTPWGQPVRKSRIQLQREGTSLEGIMVLNTEL